ncbi:MAG: hypothetical protein BM563_11095 [Bacteroidetes bacterium MedPE-SWsnd-G1]|nr:MAG: hypothetical protein BM563_11095 [Bacteroidetes bacterium MedPE-SWsnd-G1]
MGRILIITPEFPPQPGGIGNHAWNLASQLQQNNYEVLVITNSRNESEKESEFDNKQSVIIKRIAKSNFNTLTYLKRVILIKNQLKLFNPNIVFFSGKFPIWMLGVLRLKNSIKKIAVVHGSELTISNKFKRWLLLTGLSKSFKIIAVSNFTKSLIPKEFHSKTEVINNGFNKHALKRNSVIRNDKESLDLITVGAMSQRKGQHNVIKVLPLLKEKYKHIKYHIVGIPGYRAQLEELSIALDVKNEVVFHNVLHQNELNDLLAKSTIFMMLSQPGDSGELEGFGIALLEANYVGIPSIGSKNCGIEDAINDRKSGILVDAFNLAEIECAIEEIMSNYKQYQQNTLEWSKMFTWEEVVKNYINIIES